MPNRGSQYERFIRGFWRTSGNMDTGSGGFAVFRPEVDLTAPDKSIQRGENAVKIDDAAVA
jgi:hypothetical protein